MTDEDIATIAEAHGLCVLTDKYGKAGIFWYDDGAMAFVRAIEKVAVAAEREACAKACEDVDATHGECPELARYCAAEIRLRANPMPSATVRPAQADQGPAAPGA